MSRNVSFFYVLRVWDLNVLSFYFSSLRCFRFFLFYKPEIKYLCFHLFLVKAQHNQKITKYCLTVFRLPNFVRIKKFEGKGKVLVFVLQEKRQEIYLRECRTTRMKGFPFLLLTETMFSIETRIYDIGFVSSLWLEEVS